jgi:cell division protein FtsI (penicillin-binding protein 3)
VPRPPRAGRATPRSRIARTGRTTRKGSTVRRSAPSSARGPRRRSPARSRSPRRVISLFVMLMIGFGGLGVRLIVLQLVEAPAYARLAAAQRKSVVEFPARRGSVFDRDGQPLAISVDLQTIYADPALVNDPVEEARRLAPALDEPESAIETKLAGRRPGSRFEYIARQVEPKVSRAVKELKLPGVYMRPEPKRYYPNGRLGSQVLGFVNVDGNALSGVEREYDAILSGRPGRMVLEEDPAGRPLPQADFDYARPQAGRSLFLTLDKDIQYYTQLQLARAVQQYHAQSGSVIVMRPRTGEILAMANMPDFDPNHFSEFSEDDYRNRAVTDVYEPGSSYKLVTASAALQEQVVTPRTTFIVPDQMPYADRVFHDSHYHAPEKMTVTQIIEQSSNVGTIKIGLELGGKDLDAYVRKFGFGAETGLAFPGESAGIVLDRSDWSGSTIATIPIGQGIAVTAIQMASAYASLANGGLWVEPKLLYGTMADDGRVRPSSRPTRRRVVSRRTARQMTKILTGVVTRGTGLEAHIPGYVVAGKTGTAQKALPGGGYGNSYVASFAGYAPARHPAVMTLVVLDDPSPIWGGSTAAPTFASIEGFALRHLGVAPSHSARRAAQAQREQTPTLPSHD